MCKSIFFWHFLKDNSLDNYINLFKNLDDAFS